jgi:predicted nucleic acid-binding protein
VFCFDTDVLSALVQPRPPLDLVRRVARLPAEQQCTTAVTLGELLYGVARQGDPALTTRVRELVESAGLVLPFDAAAAEVYGPLRTELKAAGQRLAEADLRIASIALSRDAVLVTGNVRHFGRVPQLTVENWLTG